MSTSPPLQDWLLQTQLTASSHDGPLVFHVEAHQVADTQKHLITGPHLLRTQVAGLNMASCTAAFT